MRRRPNAKRTRGRDALTDGDPGSGPGPEALTATGLGAHYADGGAESRETPEGGQGPAPGSCGPAARSGRERVDPRLGRPDRLIGGKDHGIGGNELHLGDAEEAEHVADVARGEVDPGPHLGAV